MKSDLTCILCPRGCTLEVQRDAAGDVSVSGNQCHKGRQYGIDEMTAPMRIVTTTVPVCGADQIRLPVRTVQPVPKSQIFAVLGEIRRYSGGHIINAPVQMGDIIIPNVCGTGTAVVASISCNTNTDLLR